MYSGEEENGYSPYNLSINFSNNLSRMGFTTKELNVYVDPDKYNKEYNEILIWEPAHNGATVLVGPDNYEGIDGCLYMEELTGKKMISDSNIAYKSNIDNFIFNMYHGDGYIIFKILEKLEELKGIDINRIFWLFTRIYHIEKGVKDEEKENILNIAKDTITIEQLKIFKELDISEVVHKYFSEKFPGELTDQEYKDFGIRLNKGLQEQIEKLINFLKF